MGLLVLDLQASRTTRCRILAQVPRLVSTPTFANGPPGPGYGGPPGPPGGRTPPYGAGGPGGLGGPPGPGPMNYRQHSPGGLSGPTSPQSANMISPGGTPRLDIGYSAPVPPPGADRRRPARLDSAPPDRKPVRTPVSGHSPGPLPSPRHPSSPRPMGSPQSANFPPRNESRQPSRGSASSTPQPPAGPLPAQQQPKPAPPPSKGPKTFEEMGVPSAKNDSDCVRILSLFQFIRSISGLLFFVLE